MCKQLLFSCYLLIVGGFPVNIAWGAEEQGRQTANSAAGSTLALQSERATDNAGRFVSSVGEDELKNMLAKFVWAFEAGNIDLFTDLFAVNVHTEDNKERSGLRLEYQNLFSDSDSRHMVFTNAHWKDDDKDSVWGDIDFELWIQQKLDGQTKTFSGAIRLHVKKYGERLVIDEFYHAYNNGIQAE